MARDHDERLVRLLRGADQHLPADGLPLSHQHHLVPKSAATQPAEPADVGTDDPTHQAVPPVTTRAAPVGKSAVPRQILEVGAECVSSARSDLCGGWSAMAISTAINLQFWRRRCFERRNATQPSGISNAWRPRRGRRTWYVPKLSWAGIIASQKCVKNGRPVAGRPGTPGKPIVNALACSQLALTFS